MQNVLLHVGCGRQSVEALPAFAIGYHWRQTRVDIDPSVQPDVTASITDLAPIADASVECVFSKHNIEHLEHHEVPLALAAFYRVLKPEGFLILRCPDLRAVAELLLKHEPEDTLYTASIYGKPMAVSPLDILYGSRQEIAEGNPFMAHRTGFTEATLRAKVAAAGFEQVNVSRHVPTMELRCNALKRVDGNIFPTLTG